MVDQDRFGKAFTIAKELKQLAKPFCALILVKLMNSAESQLCSTAKMRKVYVKSDEIDAVFRFKDILERLSTTLKRAGYDQTLQPQSGEFWSLGSIEVLFDLRVIRYGFVEPALLLPIAEPPSDTVAHFLISLPGSDFLKREHHSHFGWHYHYLDQKERRSNVILCWDCRATSTNAMPRSLFWERHAESGKAFAARPGSWSETKRRTMHSACFPDMSRWPLNEFKQAGNDAEAVWPTSAILAPMPALPPTQALQVASHKLQRSRH